VAALALAGCVAVVPYEPKSDLVSARGKEEAGRQLAVLLNRAVQPRVTSVAVTDDFVEYGWQETYPGPFYVPVTASHLTQIFFANVARIEVYENFNVFLWAPGDARVDKVLFATLEDAKGYADWIASMRSARPVK
jgi:hypothetical protein